MAEMKLAIDDSVAIGLPSVTSLNAATSGNGSTADFGAAKQQITAAIILTGTVTGGVVDLQVSHDGTNWVKHASSAALATGVNQKIDYVGAARYARAVVSTNITGGGSATVTLMATT